MLAIGTLILQAPASSASFAAGTLEYAVSDATPNSNAQFNQGDQILVGSDGSRYVIGNMAGINFFARGMIMADGGNVGAEYVEKFDAQENVSWLVSFTADDPANGFVFTGTSTTAALAPDGSLDLVGSYKGQVDITTYQPNGSSFSTAYAGGSKFMGFYAAINHLTGNLRFFQSIGTTTGTQGVATGDVYASAIAIDAVGNGYIGGNYNKVNGSTAGSITIGNANAQTYTTAGYQDAFLAEFDATTGDISWSAGAHGVNNEGATVTSLAVDSALHQLDVAYQGGHMSMTVFGASQTSGSNYISSNPSGGGQSVLAQYSTDSGNLNWAQGIVSSGSDTVLQKIVVTGSGEIYGAGTGSFTTTFQGSIHPMSYSVSDQSSQTPYLVKYSVTGDVLNLWGSDFLQGLYDFYSFPGLGGWVNLPVGLAVDSNNDAYITFPFKSAGTFNGSTITPQFNTYQNIFVGKISSDFTQNWAADIYASGSPSFSESLAYDASANTIVYSGSFSGSLSMGSSTITSAHTGYQAFYGVIAADVTQPPQNNGPLAISDSAIQGLTAPVTGATPVTTITPDSQFTGSVTWSNSPTTFDNSVVYTATITLTPTQGNTLTGVAQNFFTVAGGMATNNANSGIVTVAFPATAGPTLFVHHDIPQKSSVTDFAPRAIAAGAKSELTVSGTFIEKVLGIRVNGVQLPTSSWKQDESRLTISLPPLSAGSAAVQLFNGSSPVLNLAPLTVSAAPTPATVGTFHRHEIQCAKAGRGDRILFAVNPVCPVGYTKK